MDEPWWRNQSAELKAVLIAAEKRGHVTHEQFAQVMPHADPDMVEDLLTILQEKGIAVVEGDPSDE